MPGAARHRSFRLNGQITGYWFLGLEEAKQVCWIISHSVIELPTLLKWSSNHQWWYSSLVMHDAHIKLSVLMQSTILTTPSLPPSPPPPVTLLWLFRVEFNGNWNLPHSAITNSMQCGNFRWFIASQGLLAFWHTDTLIQCRRFFKITRLFCSPKSVHYLCVVIVSSFLQATSTIYLHT